MKISIRNFKSIGHLDNFQIKPLTILSGNNSSGKSSFLQLLLLLKQTLEIDSTKHPLYIQGRYYSAKSFLDLVKGKNPSSYIEVTFDIEKDDMQSFGTLVHKSLFDSFPNYTCTLRIRYGFSKNEIVIQEFEVSYLTEIKTEIITIKRDSDGKISAISNSDYLLKFDFLDEDKDNIIRSISEVSYAAFFPTSIDESIKIIKPGILDPNGSPTFSQTISTVRPNINSVKSFFETYFKSMFYIGPLRVEPRDSYELHSDVTWVGIKGEFTAQILENYKDKVVECSIPIFNEGLVSFEERSISLLDAVNIWMCKVFKFANRLYAKEVGESYSVYLESKFGIETSIKHVGFGISQVLPIIVQGLLMDKGGTLILEQPEIHLHPKIQTYLFDFLYSLVSQDRRVIVETHSDHLITRLRRRVAEEDEPELIEKLNLSFIESGLEDLEFKRIKVNEFGTYQIFPEDFIESPERELQALLKAQMKKRKLKRD